MSEKAFNKFLELNKQVTAANHTKRIFDDIRKNLREEEAIPKGRSGTSLDSSNFIVYVPQHLNPSDFFMVNNSEDSGKLVIPKNERAEDIMKIRLIEMAVNIPELYLLVNPSSLSINQEKSYTTYYTRYGPKTEWNGNKPTEITISGKSGGFYRENLDYDGAGYNIRNYFSTLAFKNIMSLVSMYKNNGFVYGTTPIGEKDITFRNMVTDLGKVEIVYKHKIYQGSFKTMSLSFEDSDPSKLDFNFSFSAYKEIDGRPAF